MRMISKLLLLVVIFTTPGLAQTGHTDFASFSANIPGSAIVTIEDFEGSPAGTLVPSASVINGFNFVYDYDGVQMRVDDDFTALSDDNYLATTDAGLMQDGDDFTINFEPSNSFGIYFITKDAMLDGDIALTFNGLIVPLIGMNIEETLPDGSFVYFLGVTDNTQTSDFAAITTLGEGKFLFNVDDLIRARNDSVLLGDVNLDGVVNLLDVQPFVDRISEGVFQAEADVNQDGVVNLLDVGPFIDILAG